MTNKKRYRKKHKTAFVLDNPFACYDCSSGEDVSLKPLADASARLARLASAAALRGGGVAA